MCDEQRDMLANSLAPDVLVDVSPTRDIDVDMEAIFGDFALGT